MNKELLKNEKVAEICRAFIQTLVNEQIYTPKDNKYFWDRFVKENTKEEVLLVTEDGIEVFNPKEMLYDCSELNWNFRGITEANYFISWKNDINMKHRHCFSSEAAREEWLVMNKPLFSVNELKKMEQYGNSGILLTIDKRSLFSKAKEKLKQ